MNVKATLKTATLLTTVLWLGACATQQPTTYYWGEYQSTLYEHFQASKISPDEQIGRLQTMIAEAASRARPVPPGVHAHLGMLYAETGRITEAKGEFETEKQLFPEAEPFMTFLLKQSKGAK